jgi:hypothetical protein
MGLKRWWHDGYVTRDEFDDRIAPLEEGISTMATQADVDALTTAVDQVTTDLAAAKTNLQGEIDKLSSANPTLDITGLQTAVAPLDTAVQALGALTPTPAPAPAPPAPPPTPGP